MCVPYPVCCARIYFNDIKTGIGLRYSLYIGTEGSLFIVLIDKSTKAKFNFRLVNP